jgi:hypothetical protein
MFDDIEIQRRYTRISNRDIVVCFLSLALVVLFLFSCFGWYFSTKFASVASRERMISATITSISHGSMLAYQFSIDGIVYTARVGQMRGREYMIGREVTVYYDPNDPTTNNLREYRSLSEHDHRMMILCICLSLGTAFALVVFLTTKG